MVKAWRDIEALARSRIPAILSEVLGVDRKEVRVGPPSGRRSSSEDYDLSANAGGKLLLIEVLGRTTPALVNHWERASRGEPKDAYDLLYVLENFGTSYVAEVASLLQPLLDNEPAGEAIKILKEDFSRPDQPGPMRTAEFLGRSNDAGFRADRAGAVVELLRALGL